MAAQVMKKFMFKVSIVFYGVQLVSGLPDGPLIDLPKIYGDPGSSFGLDLNNVEDLSSHTQSQEQETIHTYNPGWITAQRQNIYNHPDPHLNKLIKLARGNAVNRRLQESIRPINYRSSIYPSNKRRRSLADGGSGSILNSLFQNLGQSAGSGSSAGSSAGSSIGSSAGSGSGIGSGLGSIIGGSGSGGSSGSGGGGGGSGLMSGNSGMSPSPDGLMQFLTAVSDAIDNVADAGSSALGGTTTTPSPSAKLMNGFLSILNGFQTFGLGATDIYKQLIVQNGQSLAGMGGGVAGGLSNGIGSGLSAAGSNLVPVS